jgi:YHS domain-containing protein
MVCGRVINGDPAYFPVAEYQGRTIYFCTEFCLHAFQKEPDQFYRVHSKQAAKAEPCEFLKEDTR